MRLIYSHRSDPGLVRSSNQDFYAIDPLGDRSDAVLLIVADGMGGYEGGEIASRLAVETMRTGVVPAAAQWVEQGCVEAELNAAIRAANLAILQAQKAQPGYDNMGTTLTTALIWGDQIYIAHIGDSRAFVLHRDGNVGLTTADHNVAGELLLSGHLTAAQAAVHPQRHVLTRALGIDQNISIDTLKVQWQEGETLLLCTDGLSNLVGLPEVAAISLSGPHSLLADRLVTLANDRGGYDNITVLSARWEG